MEEIRIDSFLVKTNKFTSREKAQSAISSGQVFVNGKVCQKVSTKIDEGDKIEIKEGDVFVSRGAYKLLKAKEAFGIDFYDKIVLDIGASTGGFSQVALLSGAKKVYSLDVGKGELDESLAQNPKIVNLENTDFREVDQKLISDAEIVVGDISFISLRHIFPKIKEFFGQKAEIYMLFKPQFECGKELAKRFKGVIKDKKVHISVLRDFVLYLKGLGYEVCDLTYSSIKGKAGNIEYLFAINGNKKTFDISKVVEEAFEKLKGQSLS
jgi:23S rRNA (cytidine1920-2'-O)/16S rRNA (cytidine1409-2'-O)-methyltransferase